MNLKKDVEDMVDMGEVDKAKRKIHFQMQDELRIRYPGRLDIPTTYHIGSFVSSYRDSMKRRETQLKNTAEHEIVEQGQCVQSAEEVGSKPKRRKSYRMPSSYVRCLEQLVRSNESMGTSGIRLIVLDALMIDHHDPPDDLPST